jgi:hypothetical protein
MAVYYPPVGIAHITKDLSDLLKDRLSDVEQLRVACVLQPKTDPHFGTMIVLLSSFALAAHLKKTLKLPASVLIDVLDNSPALSISIDGKEYTKCLSHHVIDGRSAAKVHVEPVVELATWSCRKSVIPFTMRPYTEIQAQPAFRRGLRQMLLSREFVPMMSPSEGVLRVRPVCSTCGLVDKTATNVRFQDEGGRSEVSFTCPHHGLVAISLLDSEGVIDANAPIRTVLRSLCFASDRSARRLETIVVNGSDWAGVWMQRVYFDGLCALGCTGTSIPLNVFTPQILDNSGAKLSKTIYLGGDAYREFDRAWVSSTAFRNRFGEVGLDVLWAEIASWIESPAKFFRNYSLEYVASLFGVSVQPENHAVPFLANTNQ